MLSPGQQYYWRFKGEKEYHYGYATSIGHGLWRMGKHNGDTTWRVIVDPVDIEVIKIERR